MAMVRNWNFGGERGLSTANETQHTTATETPVDRETHQQHMNISQQQRLDAEMPDEKEERLQQDNKLYKEWGVN